MHKKQKIITIVVISIISVFTFSLVCSMNLSSKFNANTDVIEAGTFNVSDYKIYFDEFSAIKIIGEEVFFGEVNSSEDAAKDAEEIWVKIYGKEQVLIQRPYHVKFDANNESWLIEGNDDFLIGAVGGVAKAIISKKDGKLIAIWHEE